MIYLQDLTREKLQDFILKHLPEKKNETHDKKVRISKMRAKQIFSWVYEKQVDQWSMMSDLPESLRKSLEKELPIYELNKKTAQ